MKWEHKVALLIIILSVPAISGSMYIESPRYKSSIQVIDYKMNPFLPPSKYDLWVEKYCTDKARKKHWQFGKKLTPKESGDWMDTIMDCLKGMRYKDNRRLWV